MSKSFKKALKVTGFVLLGCALLFAASFIPTLWLQNSGMHVLNGNWITVYYENHKEAAEDVFDLAEKEAGRLTQKLGFDEKQNLSLYIYDKQSTFQTKKYGLIALLLNLDWYIGDNKGTSALLASPGETGMKNEYDLRKYAAPHEMVHALNSILNSSMPKWLNDGSALYLTNGNPRDDLYDISPIPTLSQMNTENPVAFADMGGYEYAHTYIEFLDKTYGWNNILSLLKTGDYGSAIGKSKEILYDEWVKFLKENYSKKN